jgi:hypothetical protein
MFLKRKIAIKKIGLRFLIILFSAQISTGTFEMLQSEIDFERE